jgi:hypothetical protein
MLILLEGIRYGVTKVKEETATWYNKREPKPPL